jgi:hypothetical protein
MLPILQRKKFVERRLVGRAYIYNPIIAAVNFQQGFLRDLLKRVFRGSATDLVMALLNRELLTRQALVKHEGALTASQPSTNSLNADHPGRSIVGANLQRPNRGFALDVSSGCFLYVDL